MQERSLEVFLAIAMSRTFGKAAELLNVTASSISRELKNLEEEMGILLVDRQKGVKSIKLTPAGESFLPLVLKWQEVRKEIDDSFISQSACYLSIGGNETANNNLLPDIFIRLLEHDPPVHLKITTDPTDMMYEKIESREMDVAFVVHQEPSKFVCITPFFEDTMLVARYEKNTRANGSISGTIGAKELDPSKELYIEWSDKFRLWHDKTWDTTIGKPIQLLSPHLAPRLMKDPGQWAILPSCIRKNFGGNIVWYHLEDEPGLTFYKLTHRHPKVSALKGLEILDGILAKNLPAYSKLLHK